MERRRLDLHPNLKNKPEAKQRIDTLKARPRHPDCDEAHQRLLSRADLHNNDHQEWNQLNALIEAFNEVEDVEAIDEDDDELEDQDVTPVSYTHLTLPTNREV